MKEVAKDSLKMQWMAAAKVPEVGTGKFPFPATASSGLSDIDVVNEMKLNNVVIDHEHLKLIVRHDVMLREGGRHVQNN